MFPDAITERGSRHLNELAEINFPDTYGAVLFLVHSDEVEYFLPEYHTDLKFAQNFLKLKDKLNFLVYGLRWNDNLTLNANQIKRINIPFEVIEKESGDSGAYILVIRNERNRKIKIGNIGLLEFKKGYYCYVGSAMTNLSKRVERHKRKIKNLHWHIDYLLSKTKIIKAIEIRSTDKIECEVADALRKISSFSVRNFGSSDCNCESHLFYFEENPIHNKSFIDLILHFRIERLVDKYNL
jgi:sugar fermentation stimulation protein A